MAFASNGKGAEGHQAGLAQHFGWRLRFRFTWTPDRFGSSDSLIYFCFSLVRMVMALSIALCLLPCMQMGTRTDAERDESPTLDGQLGLAANVGRYNAIYISFQGSHATAGPLG